MKMPTEREYDLSVQEKKRIYFFNEMELIIRSALTMSLRDI
jgi:hypothetical protein